MYGPIRTKKRSIIHSILALTLMALYAAPAQASLLRFDFSGQVQAAFPDNGTDLAMDFGGQFIIDTSVADQADEANIGNYWNAVIGGSMVLGDTQWTFADGLFADVYIRNDFGQFNDLFAVIVDMVSEDGDEMTAFIQLGDESQSVFDSDAIPTMLALADFDTFVLDNDESTGGFFFVVGSGAQLQGGIESVSLTAVPLPASGLLLGSSLLMGWIARRRGSAVV